MTTEDSRSEKAADRPGPRVAQGLLYLLLGGLAAWYLGYQLTGWINGDNDYYLTGGCEGGCFHEVGRTADGRQYCTVNVPPDIMVASFGYKKDRVLAGIFMVVEALLAGLALVFGGRWLTGMGKVERPRLHRLALWSPLLFIVFAAMTNAHLCTLGFFDLG